MPPEAGELAEAIDKQIEDAANEEGGEQQESQSSDEAVKVASLMGWKPKEQWKGDLAGWRSAEAFLAEQPEIARRLRKSNDSMRTKLDKIVGEVAKLTKAQRQQMDAGQEQALEAAIEAGDTDGAKKILAAARKSGGSETEKPSALVAFEERNADWFGVDDEATAYAESLDKRIATRDGIDDPDAHMRKVEAGVKKRFPELFGKTKDADEDETEEDTPRRRAPLVSRGGRADRPRGDGTITVADMTPAQRRAAQTMDVSEKDWVAAYNKMQKAS